MTQLRLCVRRAANRVSLRVPSDVDCIEEAVALLTYHCTAGDAEGDRLRFRLQVVLAEALANAILRGNREAGDKFVDVEALLETELVALTVTDQGAGFNPTGVREPDRVDQPNGRGLFLMRHLADDIAFNSAGNSVCITLRRR